MAGLKQHLTEDLGLDKLQKLLPAPDQDDSALTANDFFPEDGNDEPAANADGDAS